MSGRGTDNPASDRQSRTGASPLDREARPTQSSRHENKEHEGTTRNQDAGGEVHAETLTPTPIVPELNDVLLGRGRVVFRWSGNHRFQREIERNTQRYRDAQTRVERMSIVLEIIGTVKTWGRFLDQVTPPVGAAVGAGVGGTTDDISSEIRSLSWCLAPFHKIRKKVGQALRYQMEVIKFGPLHDERQTHRAKKQRTPAAATSNTIQQQSHSLPPSASPRPSSDKATSLDQHLYSPSPTTFSQQPTVLEHDQRYDFASLMAARPSPFSSTEHEQGHLTSLQQYQGSVQAPISDDRVHTARKRTISSTSMPRSHLETNVAAATAAASKVVDTSDDSPPSSRGSGSSMDISMTALELDDQKQASLSTDTKPQSPLLSDEAILASLGYSTATTTQHHGEEQKDQKPSSLTGYGRVRDSVDDLVQEMDRIAEHKRMAKGKLGQVATGQVDHEGESDESSPTDSELLSDREILQGLGYEERALDLILAQQRPYPSHPFLNDVTSSGSERQIRRSGSQRSQRSPPGRAFTEEADHR